MRWQLRKRAGSWIVWATDGKTDMCMRDFGSDWRMARLWIIDYLAWRTMLSDPSWDY